jgi:polysaccharide pyruvyl transferase WcaK-like protein
MVRILISGYYGFNNIGDYNPFSDAVVDKSARQA